MEKHICKNCSLVFEYCRGCLLSPISYMDEGFCSRKCRDEFRQKEAKEPVVEDVKLIKEEISVETDDKSAPLVETPVINTTTVNKPIIKKETYHTYKNKKNKYKVHE